VKDTATPANTIVQTTKSFVAYDINADFNGPVPPPRATLTGTAKIVPTGSFDGSGWLELTPNLINSGGTIGIDDMLAGETVDEATKVTAKFKLFIGNGSGNAADGFSFNVASDIDPTTVNTGEEGTGSGLTIAFDTYDNGGAEAPAIDVKWGGAVIATTVGSTTPVTKPTLVNGQWVDVFIQYNVDTAGAAKVTVVHNNVKYYDNLDVPGGTSIATPKVALGGRTGNEFERAAVDNLVVIYNVDVPAPQPPTISITLPANNAELPAGAPATITVNAAASEGVNKVEFYANGTLLGQSTTAPYSFTVPGAAVVPGLYTITAKITDNSGVAVTSAGVNVIVRPVGAPKALYVHAVTPNSADMAAINHLFGRGFDTYDIAAPDATSADADGKKLIVVSSSVTSADVNTKFRGAAVPLLFWEASNLDDNGFEANNVNGTTAATQTAINIVNASHPIAAGLPAGLLTVYSAPDTISTFTAPPAVVPAGVIVANTADNATPVIVAIEKGAALNTLTDPATAPERRVFFFIQDNGFSVLNADGIKLFDAALTWLTGGGTTPQQAVLSVSQSGNNITITWTNGGTLYSAPAVTGPWTTTGNSTGTFTGATGASMQFFKVQNP